MSSAFIFDCPFTSTTANQGMTYTVFGESTSDDFQEAQVIEVKVPTAALTSILAVTSGWTDAVLDKTKTGVQIYPSLDFGLSASLSTAVSAMDDAFRLADATAVAPTFTDDSTSATKLKLQKYMNEDDEFTYADGQPTWLLELPIVAIKEVEKENYDADTLPEIIPSSASALVSVANTVTSQDLAREPVKLAIRNLFEQMVSAGKVSSAGVLGLANGDQLDLNVNYSLSRAYEFKVDATLEGGANSAVADAKFTIAGTEYTLTSSASMTVGGTRTVPITWRLIADDTL
jgi:hypothetical protein